MPDAVGTAPSPGSPRPPDGTAPWTLFQTASVVGGYRR